MVKLQNDLKSIIQEGPIGIYLMAFFIPFYPSMLGIAVALIWIEQFIRSPKINRTHLKTQLSWRNPGIWLLFFYLMHLVGLLHTQNMGFAKMDLGMKATLGIVPVFFMLYKVKVKWTYFVKAFIFGAFVSILVNLSLSAEAYLNKFETYYLTGEQLSQLMHRGYWAVYLSIAYFFLFKQMLVSKSRKLLLLNVLGALIIGLFILVSGSKVGFILVFLLSVWGVLSWFKRYKNKWILPVGFLVLLGLAGFVFVAMPSVTKRVTSTFNEMSQPLENANMESPQSTTARILVWDSSLELIQENFWWGVGTGDIKDELIQKNHEKGYVGIADLKLNSHNQFFNSHIAIGVFGSLFLLFSILTNILKRQPHELRKWRIGIVIILFVALLPESMLETQAGIIPYAFLLSFLTAFSRKNQELENHTSPS